jgi:TPR repeat protein
MLRNQKVYRFSLLSTLALGLALPALAQDEASPAVGTAEIGAPDIGLSDIGSPDVGAADIGSSLVEATTDTGTGSAAVTPMADATSTCDQLTADPADAQKLSSAEGVTEVSADAVAACLSAVEKSPETARLNYQAGRALRAAGDAVRAFYYFDRAQSLGSLRALVQVADAYMSGAGVTKDEGKAVDLYKQAATQGDADAAIRIGKYYSEGAAKNLDIAVQWLAGAKTAEGYLALGDLYRDGYKNDQIAFAWYQKAAELGLREGYERLAIALYRGRGVPKDEDEAVKLLNEAWAGLTDASQLITRLKNIEHLKAMPLLALEKGASGESFIAEAEGEISYDVDDYSAAMKHYERSADLGNRNAYVSIGYMFVHGKGVTKDIEKGVELLKRTDPKHSACIIGDAYRLQSPPNTQAAIEWYRKGANEGLMKCTLMVGLMLSNGEIKPSDYATALTWFQRVVDDAEDNHWTKAKAAYEIGYLYYSDSRLGQDLRQAGEWLEKASVLGSSEANYMLARMFSEGIGCKQDVEVAARLMELAARANADVGVNIEAFWTDWNVNFRKSFQNRLKALGLYSGASDGKFGKGTLAAIDALYDLGNE